MSLRVTLALAAMALGGGCSDSSEAESGSDADADGDADTDGDADLSFVDGGGTTGGPIAGLLQVWVVDDISGEPIGGAKVMVGSDAADALLGETGADGGALFEDASLDGPVDLHVLADGYALVSMYGLDASSLTLSMRVADYQPPAPTTVVISGTVSGLDQVEDPTGPNLIKMATVSYGVPLLTAREDELEPIEQGETGSLAPNLVVPGVKDTFAIEAHARKGVLWAVAGVYDTVNEEFEQRYLAVVPGFDPAVEDVTGVDLALDTALSSKTVVQVSAVAPEYEVITSYFAYDLGDEGLLAIGGFTNDTARDVVMHLPEPSTAPLADAEVSFVTRAYQKQVQGGTTADEYPTATVFDWGYGTPADIPAAMGVDDLPPPPSKLAWDGAAVSFAVTGAPSYASFGMQTEDETRLWGVTILSPGEENTVTLPALPDAWGFPGLPAGFELRASASWIDGDLNDIAFDAIIDIALAHSESFLLVESL